MFCRLLLLSHPVAPIFFHMNPRSETFAASSNRPRWTWAVIVFLVAFTLRWPSCGESFWVDELHTAWCAFADLSGVGRRAVIGNQQGGYFYAMYAWRHLMSVGVTEVYGVEAAMRSTSVLLTAFSAAGLVWGVSRVSGSLIGGVAAGLALALESNAIFFGTELRPYAAVVFLSTIVLGLMASVMEENRERVADCDDASRSRIGWLGALKRIMVHGLVMVAAAVHVTSLTVLAVLLLIFAVIDWWKNREDSSAKWSVLMINGAAGALWVLVAVGWLREHESLWQTRNAWTSFANAQSWGQLWRMWPWASLVILPLVATGLQRLRGRAVASLRCDTVASRLIVIAVLSVLIATIACFVLSLWGSIALWHRRYLVASLPLLCAAMGLAIGSMTRWQRKTTALGVNANAGFASIVAAGCLLLMVYQQGTLARLSRGEVRLAQRGEDWKSAVEFAGRSVLPGDSVWVDAGLIEQNSQPTIVDNPELEEYLRYVTGGPYALGDQVQAIGVGDGAIEAWLMPSAERPNVDPESDIDAGSNRQPAALITRQSSARRESLPLGVERHRFGRVTVLVRTR